VYTKGNIAEKSTQQCAKGLMYMELARVLEPLTCWLRIYAGVDSCSPFCYLLFLLF